MRFATRDGLLDRQRALHAGDIMAGEGTQEGVATRCRSGERSRAGLAAVEQLHARKNVRVGWDVASGLTGSCGLVVDLLSLGVATFDQHPVMLLGRRAVLERDLNGLAGRGIKRGRRVL